MPVSDEVLREIVRMTTDPVTAYFSRDMAENVNAIAAELLEARREIELADAERSSSADAFNTLAKALNWSSGGLGSAADEVVKELLELRKRMADDHVPDHR